jgi:hypothetical protein
MRIALKAAVVLVCLATAVPSLAGDPTGGKSMKKALLLSLAVPGAGQVYLGNTGRAKVMLAAEVGVWTSFTAYRIQGKMREDRYKEMARLFAGVEGERDDDYYMMLAYYVSSEDYNVDVLRLARLAYPYDREKQLEYFEDRAYFGEDSWQWDSLKSMEAYARTRNDSRHSYRSSTLTTGFAVLNRMISMVDVYLTFKLAERGETLSGPGIGMDSSPEGGIRLYLKTSF